MFYAKIRTSLLTTATITVTTAEGNKIATCNVTVNSSDFTVISVE